VVVSQPAGQGRLKVNIESTNTPGVADNALRGLHIITMTNASVQIQGDVIRSAGGTFELDEGITGAHFFVQRTTAGQGFAVTMGVIDQCGEWPTFVGGGPAMP
jgi:hypothetical protein